MVTWFERTREFLSLIEPKESKFLARLVEDFFDTALVSTWKRKGFNSLDSVMIFRNYCVP